MVSLQSLRQSCCELTHVYVLISSEAVQLFAKYKQHVGVKDCVNHVYNEPGADN